VTRVLVAALLAATASHAQAYSHFTVNADGARLRWAESRVSWWVNDQGGGGVSPVEFQAAVARAFDTWEAVPTASIAFDFGGATSAEPFVDDGLTVLGFRDEPGMERVLGATTFVIDILSGQIVEADVFFNAAFAWSTSAAGEATRFDLESVAVHEIGHLIGLGHSALGETELLPEGTRRVLATAAVMFPISLGRGSTADRQLQPDDIAGVSDLYPDTGFRAQTGAVRGRVLRGGRPVLGAHVAAFHPATGALVGGFAIGEGGEFQIAGLAPGPHVIRVEPLDDADIESFFSLSEADLDFQVTYHPRLFVAPPGGVGGRIDVTVRPK
jgi:hypothetical protein